MNLKKEALLTASFVVLKHPYCELATATLTKLEASEMKMMRDIVISIAENKTRNIWTYDHIGPTSHPGSILTKHHPLVKSQGKPSLSRFYGSIAILSPSETVHACSQATRVVSMMGTLSSSRAEVFII